MNFALQLTVGRIRPADARVYFRLIHDGTETETEINGKCKLMCHECDINV